MFLFYHIHLRMNFRSYPNYICISVNNAHSFPNHQCPIRNLEIILKTWMQELSFLYLIADQAIHYYKNTNTTH
jgi:hypothetical protein